MFFFGPLAKVTIHPWAARNQKSLVPVLCYILCFLHVPSVVFIKSFLKSSKTLQYFPFFGMLQKEASLSIRLPIFKKGGKRLERGTPFLSPLKKEFHYAAVWQL